MALKDIQTNKNDIQEYLLLISKVPEKVNKIDIDIKKELLIDIDNRIGAITGTICEMIANNPNYNYPENYPPDKLFDYWASRVSQLFNYNELKSLKFWIESSITGNSINNIRIKNYENEVWFVVGVWIATGELETLLGKYKNPTQLAKNLKPEQWSSYKTYIGDSKRQDTVVKRNTNIFNDPDKITKIYEYCVEMDFKILNPFIEFYKKIELGYN
ncbi:hypothetical protein AAGV28_08280 [Flavobacterium sp. FZUC8N2.13]|uniref:Uncharacterized protein n=1 Tax=Flavobacterium zubiriense TaxID=3138075 RepID=A0ABV4TB92_9FLAO